MSKTKETNQPAAEAEQTVSEAPTEAAVASVAPGEQSPAEAEQTPVQAKPVGTPTTATAPTASVSPLERMSVMEMALDWESTQQKYNEFINQKH